MCVFIYMCRVYVWKSGPCIRCRPTHPATIPLPTRASLPSRLGFDLSESVCIDILPCDLWPEGPLRRKHINFVIHLVSWLHCEIPWDVFSVMIGHFPPSKYILLSSPMLETTTGLPGSVSCPQSGIVERQPWMHQGTQPRHDSERD